MSTFMLNWALNYSSIIELYQTAWHPALSPKSAYFCRVIFRRLFGIFIGMFYSTTWKTSHQNPPIDWGVGEGGRYACGLAWIIFTTAIVFDDFSKLT
jgi:hypothetical protein